MTDDADAGSAAAADRRRSPDTHLQVVGSPEAGPRHRSVTPAGDLPVHVPCPFCGDRRTELLATYGCLLMTAQYYCHGCRTTFDSVREE